MDLEKIGDTSIGGSGTPQPNRQERRAAATNQRRGMGEIYLRGRVWWVAYHVRGKRIRESTGSTKHSDAVKLLKQRIADVKAGKPVGPNVEKTTFQDLESILTTEYKANVRKSSKRIKISLAHLAEFFGDYRACDITSDRVEAYKTHRQDQEAANASINRELAALRRAFTLAFEAKLVADRPKIKMLKENNRRKGFFEAEEFAAVRDEIKSCLKPVLETAYVTGWRITSELLTRQHRHLDLDEGWLRLDPGETKNGEGRMFPLTPDLREVLAAQVERTRAIERASGKVIPHLFHHDDGSPIKCFRVAWAGACDRAKLVGRIPHDSRRTAVRNLERAGVPRSAAMAMVGHKTEAIYRRYAICDESMLKEGAEKLADQHAKEKLAILRAAEKAARKVVTLPTKNAATA